jgi:hypothetical protein
MGSISPVGAQFGYTNSVLAYDDTLPTATPPATATAASPPATTAASITASATTAQKVELGNLTFEGQMASALFASSPSAADPSTVFFGGGTMASLLNNQGAAALSYLTPQGAPTIGSIVNTSA